MTAIGSTLSSVALRANLARYEKQLSDCVTCASAKTPEGKRNIQDLDRRIDDLKAQLNVVPRATSTASAEESRSATAAHGLRGRVDVYA